MAIAHELSSETAAALFAARERSPHELNDLKDMVFNIHSTLEQLSDEDRVARMGRVDSRAIQSANLADVKPSPPEKKAERDTRQTCCAGQQYYADWVKSLLNMR